MTKGKTHNRNVGGRPPVKVTAQVIDLMEEYQGDSTVTDICRFLHISSHLFYKWFNDDTDSRFNEAVTRIRERADDAVVGGFFRRAKGYDIVLSEQKLDKEGCIHDLVKDLHIPPDPGAGLNWLKNRRPEEWRDKKEVEVSGSHVELLERLARESAEDEG